MPTGPLCPVAGTSSQRDSEDPGAWISSPRGHLQPGNTPPIPMGQPSHSPQTIALLQGQPTIFIYPSDLCSARGSSRGSQVLICNMKRLSITQGAGGEPDLSKHQSNTPCPKTCPKPCPGGALSRGNLPITPKAQRGAKPWRAA